MVLTACTGTIYPRSAVGSPLLIRQSRPQSPCKGEHHVKNRPIKTTSAGGAGSRRSATEAARTNRIYTVGVGNAVSPDNTGFMDAAGARAEGTVIVDPRGTVVGKTSNAHEDAARTRIPLADVRETRRFREVPAALIAPVLMQYQPRFQPHAFLDELPETYEAAGDLVRKKMGQ